MDGTESGEYMRFKILACEVFFREICAVMSRSANTCDPEFLPKGLHDLGTDKMRPRLQERIDAVNEGEYDAILMAYGLCNNGLVGLTTRHTQVVVPKSHDCIGLFMGSRELYRKFFDAHPGTYYRTSGWIERDDASGAGEETVSQKLGLFMKYEELVQQYGEDNARYVMEMMGDGVDHYDTLAYIDMGLECDATFKKMARDEAISREWKFEEIEGSLDLLERLIEGDWGDDYLVLQPGQTIKPTHDDGVMGCE